MDIFEVQPNLPNVPEDCGPEPSLREVLIHYYSQCFDNTGSIEHAELYIAALKAKINYWEG